MKPSLAVLVVKRLVDLFIGWVGTLAFVALYPIIAILIKLESKGPVVYTQQRVGLNRRSSPYQIFKGKKDEAVAAGGAGAFILSNRQVDYGGQVFTILKFRTMRIDSEALGPQLAKKGLDPRVTRVGKWLRALHIDEIPQFVNILRGDMSFVGPRPERPHYTLQYSKSIPHYLDRTLWIKPGLTGLAQILVGYDDGLESVIRKVHYDYSYRSATCHFFSWLRMELWTMANTVLYLFVKPQFEGNETRDLASLRRAKLLDFKAHAPAKVVGPGGAEITEIKSEVHLHQTRKNIILVGRSPYELAQRIKDMEWNPKKTLDVQVNPDENFDLEDLGFLINLVQRVRQTGGRVAIKNSSPRVQKMLKEIHLDKVVDLHRPQDTVRNFMTVDVECWFHAYNLKEQVPPSTWHLQPTRVQGNVKKILDLFRANDTKATFFVLGWVADHFPDVVKMIDADGHEIATHGYYHNLITNMTPSQFEEDLEKSLLAIGKHTRQKIIGHRASNFTIVESTLWALEILAKYGIEYDSSIFPIKRERYGISRYPNRLPHMMEFANGGRLKEVPLSTLGLGNKLLPISGGGYLRLYPYRVTDRYIEQKNLRGLPAMVYFHPWEMDTEQKRLNVGPLKAFQHYINLDSTEWKISRLLERFFFTSIRENLESKRVQSLLRKNPVRIEKVAAGGFLDREDGDALGLSSASGVDVVPAGLEPEQTAA
jgi:polysaccharide deacetylase family protein (PEP-CTERM system associated)